MTEIRIGAAAVRRGYRVVALLGVMLIGACDMLKDAYTTNIAFSDGAQGRNETVPGNIRPFDLLTDCMPADFAAWEKTPEKQCETPTMRRIANIDQSGKSPIQALDRNRFQDYLMWRSEQKCEAHKAGIIGVQSSVNFVLSTVTTGVAAVAAIVTAPATSIMAAIAAITSGTRAHFNDDIFEKFIAPAVVKKIVEDRTQKILDIQNKRSTKSADGKTSEPRPMKEYTLEEGIVDVERYHQLCSFESGLASLVDPKQKFADTAAGLKQRIELLRAQQDANNEMTKKLGVTSEASKGLLQINADIARQIMVLQQQMLTAPLTVDAVATSK